MVDVFQSPFRRAALGLFLGFGVGFIVGIGGFGQPWQEAIFSAVGNGIALAFVFYVVFPLTVPNGG
ncbi:hypothetical protein [Natronococcus sp.]|uniref:hypothetical protein n=1 Tax=Natronococcus sp. TaxID=35747 RepID=UPI0025E47CF9|nr:hypothetical protein [Natronococcus sp.]